MAPRRQQFQLYELVLWVVMAALLFGFARATWEIADLTSRPDPSFLAIASLPLYWIGIIVWFFVWSAHRARRTCEECGERFLRSAHETDLGICPKCRQRSLGPEQARVQLSKTMRVFLIALTAMGVVVALNLWWRVREQISGPSAIVVVPLMAFGLLAAFWAVAFAAVFLAFFLRELLRQSEKHALAFARKCARQEGTLRRSGPLTIWSCTPDDPAPMLEEQLAIARRRLERLIDGPLGEPPPPLVLVFDRHQALAAFHHNVPNIERSDGMYAPRPARRITLSTEVVGHRLHDPKGTVRLSFLSYSLEAHKGFMLPHWLQLGLVCTLAADPDDHSSAHLNRRMLVSLAKGSSMGAAELFRVTMRERFKQLRGLRDHEAFVKTGQLASQYWSVVEFLAGPSAPADRVGRFRSFLADLRPMAPEEDVFERHFGHRFEGLIDAWQGWVREQGPGGHRPPPPEIRAGLVERLIPTVRDAAGKVQDRILAIRAMGGAGYALGADALIALLRDGDDHLKADAAWALESISGLAWGDDADRWSGWWAGLDPAVVGAAEPAGPA